MSFDIELRHLAKQFGDTAAVKDLSLQVSAGEFVSLLGPSGCGKTTTLRMIAGFEEPSSGQIFIAGRPVQGLPPHLRPVNTVFQHYALFPHMTVFENVGYGPRRRGMKRTEIATAVDDALELAGLKELGARYPAQLSGGQQQRVALARALVNKPRVLLLDEPLGALDVKLRGQMQTELKKLQKQVGIAFLYVTHDQEEAFSMSDRIGVMSAGRLVQFGTPKEIYCTPANQFVAHFIGERNLMPCHRAADGCWHLPGGSVVMVPEGQAGSILAVRSEAVRISTNSLGLTNEFRASVMEKTYLGSTILIEAGVSSDLVLLCRLSDLPLAESLSEGEQVFVGWDVSDSQLISDQ